MGRWLLSKQCDLVQPHRQLCLLQAVWLFGASFFPSVKWKLQQCLPHRACLGSGPLETKPEVEIGVHTIDKGNLGGTETGRDTVGESGQARKWFQENLSLIPVMLCRVIQL